jgi:putative MATE family efflux protein
MGRDLTEGSIHRSIWRLALPAIFSQLLINLFYLNEIFWVKDLADANDIQQALGGMLYITFTNVSVANIFAWGATALVSRSTGTGDKAGVSYFAAQTLSWAFVFSAAFGIPQFIFAPELMKMCFSEGKTPAAVLENGIIYTRILAAGAPVLFLQPAIWAVFRARGDTRTPFFLDLLALVLQTILMAVFVRGAEWGIAGVGLATLCARLGAAAAGAGLLLAGRLGVEFRPGAFFKPALGVLVRVVRIGFPPAVGSILYTVVNLYLMRKVSGLDPNAYTGAFGVALRGWEEVGYQFMVGISIAASTLVGQNLGAGKPERAAKSVSWCAFYNFGIGLLFAALFLSIPGALASVYSNDAAVIEQAVVYLVIIGLSQPFAGVQIAFEGAYAGSGNTIPWMIIATIFIGIRVPMIIIAESVYGASVENVYWVMAISTVMLAAAMAFWFSIGRWKRHTI